MFTVAIIQGELLSKLPAVPHLPLTMEGTKKITEKKPANRFRCQWSDSRLHMTGLACAVQKYSKEGSVVLAVFSLTDAGSSAVSG